MKIITAFILTIMVAADCVLAWGAQGHRVTGFVAQQLLTPQAYKEVEILLPGANLAKFSTWMDENKFKLKRTLPGSDKWHYQGESVCASSQPALCAKGNCAENKIEFYRQVLANRRAAHQDRQQALIFLIHLVGDIHQPLHAADYHDRGGNAIGVNLSAQGLYAKNLHALWDSTLVKQELGTMNESQWARSALLHFKNQLALWRRSDKAEEWILESKKLALTQVYQPLKGFACGRALPTPQFISKAYIKNGQRVVKEQLVKGGVRIAQVINEALTATADQTSGDKRQDNK